MTQLFIIFIAVFTVCVSEVIAQTPDLRLHTLTSKTFNNSRTLRVLVPPGYDDTVNKKRRYPVLYLNDGQNLFDVATSVFNPMEWEVDETVYRLIRSGELEPLIIVGIDNAGRSGRANEYLPYEDVFLQPPLRNPQGSKYPDFLITEVLPFIDRHYRTRTGPRHTALGGSSYGALIALYTVITKPGVFGRLLLESPSFYVAEARIIKESPAFQRKWPQAIYLGVGTNEQGRAACKPGDLSDEAVQDVKKLERVIRTAGGVRVKVLIEDCAVHNEAAWAKRLPEALRFLYK